MTSVWLAAVLCLHAVAAGTVTWTGKWTDNLWDSPQNWDPIAVPKATDDVKIPGAGVVIRAAASCNSLTLTGTASLTVLPAEVKVGSGGVIVQEQATIMFKGGGLYMFTADNAIISSSLGFQFDSGNLAGSWYITSSSALKFATPAQKSIHGANITSLGAMTVDGSLVALNQSAVLASKGTCAIAGGSQIRAFDANSMFTSSTGCVVSPSLSSLKRPLLSQVTIATNSNIEGLDIRAGIDWHYMAAGTASNVKLAAGSIISTIAEGRPTINGLSGKGNIQVGAPTTLTGDVQVNEITVSPGAMVTFDSQQTAATKITLDAGTLTLTPTSAIEVGSFVISGSSNVNGGSIGATSLDVSANVVGWNTHLVVASSVSVHSAAGTWNMGGGTIVIQSSAKMAVTTKLSIVSIAKPGESAPVVTNSGSISVSGVSLGFTAVNVQGMGTVALNSSSLTTLSDSFSATSITMADTGSKISGQQTVLVLDSLVGPAPIMLTLDVYTMACGKTCNAIKCTNPGQSYSSAFA